MFNIHSAAELPPPKVALPVHAVDAVAMVMEASVLCPVDELEQKSIEMLNAKDLR